MISRELALALRSAGVRWKPRTGDRFTLLDPAFDGDIFTLADMTVEPQGPADAPVLGFNGTTEWALDSVELADALWLPREDQLRELLAQFFVSLTAIADGFAVTVKLLGRDAENIPGETAEDAYALAVLARLAAAADLAGQVTDRTAGQPAEPEDSVGSGGG